MADLSKIATAEPFVITDGVSLQAALSSSSPSGTEIGLIVRNVPSGTQTVTGTITNVPSGTQTIAGTVTLSSQTVTIGSTTVTQPVSGTITNVPSGTQTVTGTVTLSSQTVTIGSTTVTQPVSGTITNVPSGTQTVTGTVATNAEANVTAGTAPSKALLGAVVYNSTLPTLTNGQTVAMQSDVNGNVRVGGTITMANASAALSTTVPAGTETAVVVREIPCCTTTTTTLSEVTVSNSSTTTILSSNANRRMALIYNKGSNFVYIKFGATASSSSFTVILQPNSLFEMPVPIYGGQIDGLADSSSVLINVTEF